MDLGSLPDVLTGMVRMEKTKLPSWTSRVDGGELRGGHLMALDVKMKTV